MRAYTRANELSGLFIKFEVGKQPGNNDLLILAQTEAQGGTSSLYVETFNMH